MLPHAHGLCSRHSRLAVERKLPRHWQWNIRKVEAVFGRMQWLGSVVVWKRILLPGGRSSGSRNGGRPLQLIVGHIADEPFVGDDAGKADLPPEQRYRLSSRQLRIRAGILARHRAKR